MQKETLKIKTLKDNNRMSTQDLLQLITDKIKEGYTDFEIEGCGQHNIGGSAWALNKDNKLIFKISNPGQRVGAMALPKTEIIVEGSAPADVGWLNSGAEITIKGDCGDTAAHCAAGGKIYVAGRVGTRSGALMKHDPKFEIPEFWVLKNTGSFSFEFMGGGIAVVCGYDCENMNSVLGHRSCVGMVGGIIYVRGNIEAMSDSVEIKQLEKDDIEFLEKGMNIFLKKIEKIDLFDSLTIFSEWKKIVPVANTENKYKISVSEFRKNKWIDGGIFGDFIHDDFEVYSIPSTDNGRVHIPVWHQENCIDCKICFNNCPQNAIIQNNKLYSHDSKKCIGCGICSAVCPKNCWIMKDNRQEVS